MKSTELKKIVAGIVGLKPSQVSVTSAGKYFRVLILPNPSPDGATSGREDRFRPMTWPALFPEEFRRAAIRAVYGPNFQIHAGACAGNVCAHSIAMYKEQWDTALEAYKAAA